MWGRQANVVAWWQGRAYRGLRCTLYQSHNSHAPAEGYHEVAVKG